MIKVSTTGMAVSLKTDLRFLESGQHGHGSRIIQLQSFVNFPSPQILCAAIASAIYFSSVPICGGTLKLIIFFPLHVWMCQNKTLSLYLKVYDVQNLIYFLLFAQKSNIISTKSLPLSCLIVSAKYCYAAHESRLHQNDRCKRFTLCLVLTVRFRSLAPWGKLFQLFIWHFSVWPLW